MPILQQTINEAEMQKILKNLTDPTYIPTNSEILAINRVAVEDLVTKCGL